MGPGEVAHVEVGLVLALGVALAVAGTRLWAITYRGRVEFVILGHVPPHFIIGSDERWPTWSVGDRHCRCFSCRATKVALSRQSQELRGLHLVYAPPHIFRAKALAATGLVALLNTLTLGYIPYQEEEIAISGGEPVLSRRQLSRPGSVNQGPPCDRLQQRHKGSLVHWLLSGRTHAELLGSADGTLAGDGGTSVLQDHRLGLRRVGLLTAFKAVDLVTGSTGQRLLLVNVSYE